MIQVKSQEFLYQVVLENIPDKSSTAERKSGDGTTPMKAIVIAPTATLKAKFGLGITKTDNRRWFYIKLQRGKNYYFETFGKGDPDVYIYKKEQVKNDGTISGDAQKMNSDDGSDGYNAKLIYRPSKSGEYYLKILLFSGKRWSGKIKYQIR